MKFENIKKLSTYLIKKKMSDLNIGDDIRKNVNRRLEYLKKILPINFQTYTNSDFLLDDVRLCILAELVYDYFSNPCAGKSARKGRDIFFNVAEYYNCPTKTLETHGHLEYTDTELNDFILFFVKNPLWKTSELYNSENERRDTLNYLNLYYQTFCFWDCAKSPNKSFRYTKQKYDSDIHKFLLALYDESQLPDMDDYIEEEAIPEEIVEEIKSKYLYDI